MSTYPMLWITRAALSPSGSRIAQLAASARRGTTYFVPTFTRFALTGRSSPALSKPKTTSSIKPATKTTSRAKAGSAGKPSPVETSTPRPVGRPFGSVAKRGRGRPKKVLSSEEVRAEKKNQLLKRVPPKPTKASGAFTYYFKDQSQQVIRSQFGDDREGKSAKDYRAILSQIGANWRALSDAEKQPWVDKAADAQETYRKAHAAWESKLSHAEKLALRSQYNKKARQSKAFLKDEHGNNVPKPTVPFIQWATTNYKSVRQRMEQERGVQKIKLAEVQRELSKIWKTVSPEEKETLHEEFVAKRAAFEKERAKYHAIKGNEAS